MGVLALSGRRLLHLANRIAPVLISLGLVAWLVWSVTPSKLYAAFRASNWPALVGITLVQLVVLFLWDTFSLWWLFSRPDRQLPFRTVLRARTDSIIWSAVNLEIGQGVFAYQLSQMLGDSIPSALGRCGLLALFDFGTLQSLGLVGSFLYPHPYIRTLRWVCVASVAGLFLLYVVVQFLPGRWRLWLIDIDWCDWLRWWRWRDAWRLWVQRLTLYALILLYAAAGLMICGIPISWGLMLGAIPFVLIAESLPGTGGLGEREAALVYLVQSGGEHRAELLCFGLIWSLVIIWGRIVIGSVSLWWPRTKKAVEHAEPQHVG